MQHLSGYYASPREIALWDVLVVRAIFPDINFQYSHAKICVRKCEEQK